MLQETAPQEFQQHYILKFSSARLASENQTHKCARALEEMIQGGLSKSPPSKTIKAAKKAKGEVIRGGGRIVRSSAGRKDRHSKVCTARGHRDRRVRLSPNTAIQFYDVQDRLGYDRPSKAIDWLLKEAKAAIDALRDHHDSTDHLNDPAIFISSIDDNHHLPPQGRLLQDRSLSNQLNASSSTKRALENHHQMDLQVLNDPTTSQISFFHAYPHQNGSLLFPAGDSSHGPAFSTSATPPNSLHSQIGPGVATSQRFYSWDANSSGLANENGYEELLINSLPLEFQPPALSQNHAFLQKEPLQSTLCPVVRASSTMQMSNTINVSYSSIGFSNDGFSSIAGQQQNPISGTPSSAPSLLPD